ncbi:Cryptochrome/DNA photolyase [Macleaya cordata]|uniref:Cryptochrome/DNA photolyase n=1 Tax=Macleaya cordata TaxID=56857 RepID=A0A200PW32_MACCD|nr:Cryptochrome/DNA photolyase [Macleaya cordata]
MVGSSKTIVWFRKDLRIDDNPALAAAAKDGQVLPVYIWCPKEEGQFYPGRVSRWWLKQSLAQLNQSLKSLGAALVLIKADSTLDALLQCINAVGATKIVYNHLYDPISLVRDHTIKQKLAEHGICVQSFKGDLLYEPWEVYDEKGHAFTTFNAFWDKCLNMSIEPASVFPPWSLVPPAGIVESCSIEELGLEDELEKPSNALLGRGWSPGWTNADKALTEFVERQLIDYSKSRVKLEGTTSSLLSPYLHFGELSVRKVFQGIRMKQILWAKEGNIVGEENVKLFLRALGLREYSRYLCFNFPFTQERSLMNNLRFFPWRSDQGHFKAWRQGKTGYPLVDAGMRELWATGWMHNRIRVIVASFFVKVLLLPWTWGMKYFWDTLLDADLESDILGWQYISGSLPDGHKLHRLDSPQVQGCKFDPEGEYVRHWLPELVRMPTEWIHHPWDAPPIVLRAAGVELGLNYPKPIIDIDLARERLADALSAMWEAEVAARAANANGTEEVVVDNLDQTEIWEIPTVVLKENVSHSISLSDQRVPSFQNCKSGSSLRKRSMCWEDERPSLNNVQNNDYEPDASRTDEDLHSTAESSSTKKRSTGKDKFLVPPLRSSLKGESFHENKPPDMTQRQKEMGREQVSSKQGRDDGEIDALITLKCREPGTRAA